MDQMPGDAAKPEARPAGATVQSQAEAQALQRRQRSAAALRANLKRRKAQRGLPGGLDND
jgi:hypothetical protein